MKQQLSFYQDRVNQVLKGYLAQHHHLYDVTLAEAIEYSTLNKGKRIRPALLYAIGEALGIPLTKLDSAAAAIELIHSYSLVHDDLPAMDNDDLRRGQPTCHIQYSEFTAILVGDAQQSLAYECLAQDALLDDATKLQLIKLLSQASGAQGMIGGQYLDMQSQGQLKDQATLEKIHQMKTGALIKAALLMGACQSKAFIQKSPGVGLFGERIGLAFQVQDDIMDIESTTEQLGKPAGSDKEANKLTYPKLLGLAGAKQYRDNLISEALATLQSEAIRSPFLESLTHYIGNRQH